MFGQVEVRFLSANIFVHPFLILIYYRGLVELRLLFQVECILSLVHSGQIYVWLCDGELHIASGNGSRVFLFSYYC